MTKRRTFTEKTYATRDEYQRDWLTAFRQAGHIPVKTDGRIDIFAYNPFDPHNGPRCKNVVKAGVGIAPRRGRYLNKSAAASHIEREPSEPQRIVCWPRPLKSAAAARPGRLRWVRRSSRARSVGII